MGHITSVSAAGSGDDPGGRVSTGRTGGRSVLLIEDSLAQAAAYTAFLSQAGYDVEHMPNGEAALAVLAVDPPDIVVLDLCLPGIQGVDVLRYMRKEGNTQPVIVITDHASVDVAVSAMKEGACDFMTKPFGADRLRVTVENALRQCELSTIVETFRENYERQEFHGFIGSSLVMQSVYRIIESAAASRATIFITGESGTGKELCAHAVHAESPRSDGPFVPINCAAIPNSLIESEIFGYIKGAFTGADRDHAGAAMQADGGTLFFDEICDMDLDLQAKLLRFIQTGAVRPVGSSKEQTVDVRFICATNRDPLEEIRIGRFREDLYYRLHVVPIVLPALRERAGDIVTIGKYLLQRIAIEEGKRFRKFSVDAEQLISSYEWPGNVRQLENIIRNIVVLYDGDIVTPKMIPAPVNRTATAVVSQRRPGGASPRMPVEAVEPVAGDAIRSLRDIEKETIEKALEVCNGNVPKAAALLDVSPSTVYRKRQSWIEN